MSTFKQDFYSDAFFLDPIIRGYDTSFWKTISGSPSISSNNIRLNSATIASYPQFMDGQFSFQLTIPAVPTVADARKWGLLAPAAPTIGAKYFEITDTTFRAVSYDDAGNQTVQNLTWSSTYTATATTYKIIVKPDFVLYLINGVQVARIATSGLLSLPIYLINGNADNVDMAYMFNRNIDKTIV